MSANSKTVYPYPVYSPTSDDYESVVFDAGCSIIQNKDDVLFSFDIVINDKKIKELIRQKKAGLYCLITCASTKFNETFEMEPDNNWHSEKMICGGALIGRTFVKCLIIAKEKIVGFTDENFSVFYKNESVNFPLYSIIGYSDDSSGIIYKNNYITGNVPSICMLSKRDDIKEIQIDFSSREKIFIYLPDKDYSRYKKLDGKMTRTKQAMLFLPALTMLVDLFKNGQADDYADTDWYPVIEKALLDSGITSFDSDGMPEDSFVYAQRILSNPIHDAMNEISSFDMEEDQ